MGRKLIVVLVVMYIAVIIIAPVFLQYCIFPNNVYSAINNEAWASFLGSYLGGIIGGGGTLIAVIISVKQTEKIQRENHDLTLNIQQRDYMNTKTAQVDNHNVMKKIQEDARKVEEKKVRIAFCNSMALLLGKYIEDISKYYYNCHILEKNNEADRSKSIECYYALKIRMQSIPLKSAKVLLDHLDIIHEMSCDETIKSKDFSNIINNFCKLSTEFIDEYIEME